ncbi:MAG: hypothetical protein H3C48_00435 [Chitinophagaceae bacterium]|nr:hypothetical protein [Chitinophagaceae bacterium]
MKPLFVSLIRLSFLSLLSINCNSQTPSGTTTAKSGNTSQKSIQKDLKEGVDYTVLTRARIMDKTGFNEPVEVFSFLIPRNWNYSGDIVWVMPGQTGQGTYSWFQATSPDKSSQFSLYPDLVILLTDQPVINQANQAGANEFFMVGQPVDAITYLTQFFLPQIGNPQIIKSTPEEYPQELLRKFEEGKQELLAAGMTQLQASPSAVSAHVKWGDGSEGIVGCTSLIAQGKTLNHYNGQYNTIYTATIANKIVFRFPSHEKEHAEKLLATIKNSERVNHAWKATVDNFWKAARQRSRIDTWNKVRMMDEYTRQIGRNAIKRGNDNLAAMDANMRNWEARQQAQDQMHSNFIKAIREVETYRDATGTYEMSSNYNHAWSRNDGSSFIMTDNPNFDPAFIFQDQEWKEMKRVKN